MKHLSDEKRRPTTDSSTQTQDLKKSEFRQSGGASGSESSRGFSDKIPNLELPKSGGAIRGVGEKFSLNPATGSGSVSIPILATPARGIPQLTLSYDSGAGNGPFGMGWDFGVPQITRKTEKGLPQYNDRAETDTYILSGAEDLVPLLKDVAGNWEIDEYDSSNYSIRRFRPRTEGLFARIERFMNKSDPTDVWWRTITKENVASYFGHYPGGDFSHNLARISDPADPAKIFSWLLTETLDDRGNRTLYEYKEENNSNIQTSALHETTRSKKAQPQRYLKRIYYGNSPSGVSAPSWGFVILFDYGEHSEGSPTLLEDQEWPTRVDSFSRHRSGFEIRTRRLCRRILCFHHLPNSNEFNLGGQPVLTKSTDFDYDENLVAAKLTAVSHCGYQWNTQNQTYEKQSLPELKFDYSKPKLDDQIRLVESSASTNTPQGLSGPYRFLDLDGEGLSGILSEQAGGWYYKRNEGGGSFASLRRVASRPSWASFSSGAQMVNLEGDGQPYLVSYGNLAGYAERNDEGDWAPFRSFQRVPNIDWTNPDIRYLDLDGDGKPDLAIFRDEVICWHRNEGKQGYSDKQCAYSGFNEDLAPARIFQNNLESIFTADMTGDGLQDIVRIRNNNVNYWPNLGFGRFGEKVVMDDAPVFDEADYFDASRVRLGDIDGSGTTDILYLGRSNVRFWINQSGNSFASGTEIKSFPQIDNVAEVVLIDLLGNGTSCLVWSSPLAKDADSPWRYVDLMSNSKPYLLTRVDNNMGAITRLSYRPSTWYYMADRHDNRPWITKLPFPVQVVERVEVEDQISGNRLVSRYAYHHGYYDRPEREFRGFGMVEQWDSEGVSESGDELFQRNPVLTRTWFHTGSWIDENRISSQYRSEYYDGDQEAWFLDESEIIDAVNFSPQELREARRALRGQMLRQEIYECVPSDDVDTLPKPGDHPYTAVESRFRIQRLQPVNDHARYGVFLTTPLETLSYHYEQNPADPRIAHELTLEIDDYGNPLSQAAVAYPRRKKDPPAIDDRLPEQKQTLITRIESQFAHDTGNNDWLRHSLPIATRAYQITGLSAASGEKFELSDFDENAITFAQKSYEEAPGSGPTKRLIGAEFQFFRADSDAASLTAGELAYGTFDTLALPHQSYTLVFTDGLRQQAFGSKLSLTDFQALMAGQGYVERTIEGISGWWRTSGIEAFDPAQFYQVTTGRDPFGEDTQITYDSLALLPVAVTDPIGNTIASQNDYRHFTPWKVTDPNGNSQEAAFDLLGRVVKTAVIGKNPGEGDTLNDPTTEVAYFVNEWKDHQRPNYVTTKSRETHGDPNSRWMEAWFYSDGFGRELMAKARVAPGDAHFVSGGVLQTQPAADPRYVGTGRTLYDNKGNPVKQYEPYFSTTSDFEDEDDLVQWGVTPILHYDALSRVIKTTRPDGAFSKVEFDPWQQTVHDENDTINDSDNTWATTTGGNPALVVGGDTPGKVHLDVLGREILVQEDPGTGTLYETRTVLDILGNQLSLTDANGNVAQTQEFDIGGRPYHSVSNDAGEGWTVLAADDQPVTTWTGRGHIITQEYDVLRRPTHTRVTAPGGGTQTLVTQVIYGETALNPASSNLKGQVYQIKDQAGVMTFEAYDFKGNLTTTARQLVQNPDPEPDWSGAVSLATEIFTTRFEADALSRNIWESAPDGSEITFLYDEGGLFTHAEVKTPQAAAPKVFVEKIEYDAKGQRTAIEYGNGVITNYTYDPLTFRLTSLVTIESGNTLQDIAYTYDPVGNILEAEDKAQPTIFINNQAIQTVKTYAYDPLYRLISATGREHTGQNPAADQRLVPTPQAHKMDGTALRTYNQTYQYDPVGNILQMKHSAGGTGSWTRDYKYDYQAGGNSNRLTQTTNPANAINPVTYSHDPHGNIEGLPQLGSGGCAWDYADRLREVDLNNGHEGLYAYDNGSERVRKTVTRGNITEERIYLGFYEIYRKYQGSVLKDERTTLHVMDDVRRIAMVETKTRSGGNAITNPSPVTRYQMGDYLDSTALELTDNGEVISYEEFHPYGTTALYAENGMLAADLSRKRYRYTGKERDDETGLNYHSARYYMPWLGRWLSSDPAGMVDGPGLYVYARGNPLILNDPTGEQASALDVNVTEDDNSTKTINVSGRIYFNFPASIGKEEKRAYLNTIQNSANTFGNITTTFQEDGTSVTYQFHLHLQILEWQPGMDTTDSIMINVREIDPDSTNTREQLGISNVTPSLNRGVFYLDNAEQGSEFAHEFGHFLGLNERYRENWVTNYRTSDNNYTYQSFGKDIYLRTYNTGKFQLSRETQPVAVSDIKKKDVQYDPLTNLMGSDFGGSPTLSRNQILTILGGREGRIKKRGFVKNITPLGDGSFTRHSKIGFRFSMRFHMNRLDTFSYRGNKFHLNTQTRDARQTFRNNIRNVMKFNKRALFIF